MKASQPNGVDVLFCLPPDHRHTQFVPHLGMAYIQAFLAQSNIRSEQFIMDAKGYTILDCAMKIIASKAPIIGICCYDDNCGLVREIATAIKKLDPSLILIAGGPAATFSDYPLLENCPALDLAVRFEGEITCLELVDAYLGGSKPGSLERIPGITYRTASGIVRNETRKLFGFNKSKGTALDGLPSPYLSGVFVGGEASGIVSARGCIHKCTYCNFSAMSQQTIRYHSVSRVIEELKMIESYQIQQGGDSTNELVVIHDDAFSLNITRAKEICRRILDEGLRINLSALCRADNIDEELVELMSSAGFVALSFGLESAVPEVLRTIRKVSSLNEGRLSKSYRPEEQFLEKISKGVWLGKKYGMKTLVSTIFGLPGETLQQGCKTIDFVRQLDVDYYTHNFLTVHRGTEIFHTAADFGIEVTQTKYGIPLTTRHSYPVQEVPYLQNSNLVADQVIFQHNVYRVFCGTGMQFYKEGSGVDIAILKIDSDGIRDDVIRWLSLTLGVNAHVLIIAAKGVDHWSVSKIDLVYRQVIENGRKPIFMHLVDEEDGIYRVIPTAIPNLSLQCKLVPFSKFAIIEKEQGAYPNGILRIFQFDSEKALSILSYLIEMFEKEDSSQVYLDGVFADGCRWSVSPCPALQCKRFVVSSEGGISPCLNGDVVGNCNMALQEIQSRIRTLAKIIEKERGCANCSINGTCAKCLFPYPLTGKSYCRTMRESKGMRDTVMSINLAHTYNVIN